MWRLFGGYSRVHAEQSTPEPTASPAGGSCPVPHDRRSNSLSVMASMASGSKSDADTSGCPVHPDSKAAEAMAEAAGSDVNRANYMPTGLNQRPAPGQQTPLSIQRVVSTIPKGDYEPAHQLEGSDTWTYPSPQMFYNAMRRKGYSPREGDMGNIVAIHNTVNERAWEKVMEWERMYSDRCPNPKLFKFKGLADDPSPKARVLSWAGYRPPFDRHDWIVDRCGTKQRYIIDFYNGRPSIDGRQTMHIDARPAIDSPGALFDRVKRFVKFYFLE